ncbi:alcohol dehydrogenase catalytic domain-containing protein [Streptomyces sp. NPDC054833]
MLAIHLTRFGEPEQSLKVVDVPEPGAPAIGQALVQVEYAPLDHHDLLLAQGVYPVRPELPSAIGNEGVGTVLAVGPDVTHVRPGDTVLLPFGTFAWSEQVLAVAAKLTVVDKSIGLDQAAMLTINPTSRPSWPTQGRLRGRYRPVSRPPAWRRRSARIRRWRPVSRSAVA